MHRVIPLATLLILAACGQQEEAKIEVSQAWSRPTVGQAPGAVYLTIENRGSAPDRLTGVFTDHAAMAMVHQNEVVDGVVKMRMADAINIPANDRIEMRPGGTHIMLEGLRAPLRTGDDFNLVLKFKNSKDRTVTVTVLKPEGQ